MSAAVGMPPEIRHDYQTRINTGDNAGYIGSDSTTHNYDYIEMNAIHGGTNTTPVESPDKQSKSPEASPTRSPSFKIVCVLFIFVTLLFVVIIFILLMLFGVIGPFGTIGAFNGEESLAINCGQTTPVTSLYQCNAEAHTVSFTQAVCTGSSGTVTGPIYQSNLPGVTFASPINNQVIGTFPTSNPVYTVTASCLDTSTTQTCQVVVVLTPGADTTNPTVNCPDNVDDTSQCGGNTAVQFQAATTIDNCGTSTTQYTLNGNALTVTNLGGSNRQATFGVGTNVVTYTSTDAASNANQCTFNVIVNDVPDTTPTTNPIVNCPGNEVDTAPCGGTTAVEFQAATSSDNCGPPTTQYTLDGNPLAVTNLGGSNRQATFGIGINVVTFTATDAAGNTNQCTFDVIVTQEADATNPRLNCPSNVAQPGAAPCDGTTIVEFQAATASDNCGPPTTQYTLDGNPLTVTNLGGSNRQSTFGIGTNVVTFTATDAAGNTNQCTFDVIVTQGGSSCTWTAYAFDYDDNWNSCHGQQYVKSTEYDPGKFVGVVLCSPTRYKIFLSDDLEATFRNIADSTGNGQDHCELVGAESFDSGVNIDSNFWDSPSATGYFRSLWGDQFQIGNIGGVTGDDWTGNYYGQWYECGVSIP